MARTCGTQLKLLFQNLRLKLYLIADELGTVAFDAVDGLKDVDLMFRAELVPGHAEHAVDAAPTYAVSEHVHSTTPLDVRSVKCENI